MESKYILKNQRTWAEARAGAVWKTAYFNQKNEEWIRYV